MPMKRVFSGGPGGKNLPAACPIPKLGRPPGETNVNPLQYSCPENSMDREAWWATVCGGLKELDMVERLTLYAHQEEVKKDLNV